MLVAAGHSWYLGFDSELERKVAGARSNENSRSLSSQMTPSPSFASTSALFQNQQPRRGRACQVGKKIGIVSVRILARTGDVHQGPLPEIDSYSSAVEIKVKESLKVVLQKDGRITVFI